MNLLYTILEQITEESSVTAEDKFHHHQFLPVVAGSDVTSVIPKDKSYGASWKKRGGVSAFMMLARKWDRLESMLSEKYHYDIFAAIGAECRRVDREEQGADGTILAEVRDLRRYLLLVEAEMVARGAVSYSGTDHEGMSPRTATIVAATQGELSEAAGGPRVPRMQEQAPYEQRTPEDGAQAASTAPHVVRRDYFLRKEIDPELAHMFWRPLGNNQMIAEFYALEPHVVSHKIPRVLAGVYDMLPDNSWLMRAQRIPADAREHFPVLRREVNTAELDELQEWHRWLYAPLPEKYKWVIAGKYEAWTQGVE